MSIWSMSSSIEFFQFSYEKENIYVYIYTCKHTTRIIIEDARSVQGSVCQAGYFEVMFPFNIAV